MNKEDLNITLQSKKEYIDQFINLTLHHFKDGFKSIYENVKEKNTIPKLILKEFQDQLKLIPQWSQHIIDEEYKRIKTVSKCEYLDDLIQAMFASYSQILLADSKSYDNLNISIPTPSHVIHSCYISIARKIWKKPDLFYHKNNYATTQNNLTNLNKIITEELTSTIRNLLPFKEILENYLENESINTETNININNIQNSQEYIENNQEEAEDTEDAVEDANDIVEDAEDAEGIVEDANDIVEDAEDAEGIVEDANDIVEDTEDAEGIVEDANDIVEDAEGVVEDAEGIVEDAEGIVEDAEGIVEDAEGIVEDAEGIVEDAEGVVEDAEGVVEDAEGIVEDAEGVVEDEEDAEDVVDTKQIINDTKNINLDDKINEYDIVNNEEINEIKEEIILNGENTNQNDFYNNEVVNEEAQQNNNVKVDQVKEIVLENKKKKSSKKRSSKRIQNYLGVNMDPKDFKKNKDNIKKMLLHKNVIE